jgi:hypothetical protein
MEDWFLEMSMIGPYGQRYTMRLNLDGVNARGLSHIEPPSRCRNLTRFTDTVEILKRRKYRKDLFIDAARRIGALLAERMEDAEGWHDISRQGPAKAELAQ